MKTYELQKKKKHRKILAARYFSYFEFHENLTRFYFMSPVTRAGHN